jgi:hypothetical protein
LEERVKQLEKRAFKKDILNTEFLNRRRSRAVDELIQKRERDYTSDSSEEMPRTMYMRKELGDF